MCGAEVGVEVPSGTDVRGQFAGRERWAATVVDVDAVRRGRRQLVPVDARECLRDDRPRVRVRRRFAGEVSGIELRERGVDVVGVERDVRHDPLVGVDLGDAEDLGVERLGPLSRPE